MMLKAVTAFLVASSVFFGGISQTVAQERDQSLEQMLADADLEGRAVDRSAVEKSTVSEVNRKVQWRLFKRVAEDGASGVDELAALEADGRSLGYVNQPTIALAVTKIASEEQDLDTGHEMFRAAKHLMTCIQVLLL